MIEVQRMQTNLLLIRRAVGWTATEFGDRIGVTRQTINNIESGRNKLTKTQYIAMRSVLDAEIARHPEETKMLRVLLDVLIDHPDAYTEEECKRLLEKANLLSPSILTGTATREAVSNEWIRSTNLLGIAAAAGVLAANAVATVAVGVGAGAISSWLAKAVKISDKKKD